MKSSIKLAMVSRIRYTLFAINCSEFEQSCLFADFLVLLPGNVTDRSVSPDFPTLPVAGWQHIGARFSVA